MQTERWDGVILHLNQLNMLQLQNYAKGQWVSGIGEGQKLFDAVDGSIVGIAGSEGLDLSGMFDFARSVGGTALREMTFQERGLMLKALALRLTEIKEKYYPISYRTGATKSDSWIDIDGGIGTLFAYASLRRKFPDQSFFVDGELAGLSKSGNFAGHHIMVPKEGVAVHINAFNFPIWGMLEKISVNLLAGMPAIVKPATITSFLTEAMVRDIVASGILPEGSLQLICGSAQNILDHVESQDVVTFTGSASTGRKLKSHPRILAEAVPFNMEADSLNCCILGEDVQQASPDFDVFIKEVHREMTAKCGQKCTAIRRIIVPEQMVGAVHAALEKRLDQTPIGNPVQAEVKMGALAGKTQLKEVMDQLEKLKRGSSVIYDKGANTPILGAEHSKGAFMSPVLLLNEKPHIHLESHEIEAFGPVSTIMPYSDIHDAVKISKLGKGSLVSSVITSDPQIAKRYVLGAAAYHGRILVLNASYAKESTGHGSPMPLLVHGGPGRAGGGEEMGGLRGVKHYLQRTAIQGSPSMLSEITQVYQAGAKTSEYDKHLFQMYFDELNIGDSMLTAKHTVTEADIVNFANISGDHFYAHTDVTSLDGTIFTGRVAHGYYILSKAAGLFVDARKGPVLLNYGLDECRFTKPVYPGMTIGVRLTVKEKTAQEKKNDDDIPKGIVRWLVEVSDETGEMVALATILTMVKRKAI